LGKIRTTVQTQAKNNKVFQDEGLKIAKGASTVVIKKVFEPTRLRVNIDVGRTSHWKFVS
jgi:hypothetical protein